MQAYPNLDPLDAKALSWIGLQGSNAWDSIQTNHPDHVDDMNKRNMYHFLHIKGTPCQ